MAKRPYNPLAQPSERTIAAINDYLSGDGQQYHPGVSSLTRQPFVNYSQAEINVLRDTSWMSQSPGGGGAKSTYAEFGKGMRGAGFMDKGGNLTSDGMEAYRKAGLDPSSLKFEGSNFSSKNFARDAAKEAKASSSSKTEVTMKLDSKSQQTMEKFASGFETGAKIFERRTSGSMGMGSSADIRGESYSAHRKSLGGTQEATPLNQLPTHGASLGGGPTGGGGGRKPPINLTGATQEHLSFAKKPNSSLSSGFNRFQEQAVGTMKQPPYGWFETQGHSSHRTESGRRVAEYQKALAESKNVISSVAPRTTVTSAAVPATRVSVDPSTIPISSTDHRRSVSAIATARYRDQLAGSKTVSTVAAAHPFVPKVQVIPAATSSSRVSVDPQSVEALTTGHRRDDTAIARARMQEAEQMQRLRYQAGQGRVGSGATVESSVAPRVDISPSVASVPLSMPVDDGSIYTTNRPTTRGYDGSRQGRVNTQREVDSTIKPKSSVRYNQPGALDSAKQAASAYYNQNIGPHVKAGAKRMVHHAGSGTVWGATGLAIGAGVSMVKSSAGEYAEDLDAAVHKLIGLGLNADQRAYVRSRAIRTSEKYAHTNPVDIINTTYELGSGIKMTDDSIPNIMNMAEATQVYGLTYMEKAPKTALEIGKLTNTFKHHPSYKGLSQEEAYNRTFYHMAPIVESELLHGSDIMTAMQYFGNPAMQIMGWSPGEAMAMSSILTSAGISPSTSGTSLRQLIDENILKGMARTQFVSEQTKAYADKGLPYRLLKSGASERFFNDTTKPGGQHGTIIGASGAPVTALQKQYEIRRQLMGDIEKGGAAAFLSKLELQRRQVTALTGSEYGFTPQQLGLSATSIPTLYSMTPERVQEILALGARSNDVISSESEQKKRAEEAKNTDAPGSRYSRFKNQMTGWLMAPGGIISENMEGWSRKFAENTRYHEIVDANLSGKPYAYQKFIQEDAQAYVASTYGNRGFSDAKMRSLQKEREFYLKSYYDQMSAVRSIPVLGTALRLIPGAESIAAGAAAASAHVNTVWYGGLKGFSSEEAVNMVDSASYNNQARNSARYGSLSELPGTYAKYINEVKSGYDPMVSRFKSISDRVSMKNSVNSINSFGAMVTSSLPLSGFMSPDVPISRRIEPKIDIMIGNKEIRDFSVTASTEAALNRRQEEAATSNNDSSSSVPIDTNYDLPTIGNYNFQ